MKIDSSQACIALPGGRSQKRPKEKEGLLHKARLLLSSTTNLSKSIFPFFDFSDESMYSGSEKSKRFARPAEHREACESQVRLRESLVGARGKVRLSPFASQGGKHGGKQAE